MPERGGASSRRDRGRGAPKPTERRASVSTSATASAAPRVPDPRTSSASHRSDPAAFAPSRFPIYEEHLDEDTVAAGIASGALFSAKLRINATDRSQAFVTLPGLPYDVLIKGDVCQNRTFEGDVVAFRILPPAEWHEQGSGGRRGSMTTNPKPGAAAGTRADTSGNIVPFSPSSIAETDAVNNDDLVAAPALVASPSGGDIAFAGPTVSYGGGGGQNGYEDMGMSTYLSQQFERQAVISSPTARGGGNADGAQLDVPWAHATTPKAVIAVIQEELIELGSYWRVTATVVAIVKPSHRRRTVPGCLLLVGRDQKTLLLYPRDLRLPAFVVPVASLPRAAADELLQEAARPNGPPRTPVAATFRSWSVYMAHPTAEVTGVLGKPGDILGEVAALLAEENIKDDDQFTPRKCLPASPWSLSPSDLASRRDLRSWRIFSIDPPTARDLDDALSVQLLDSGALCVGVHIADVSHFVRRDTPLDIEAQGRSTSTYLLDRVIPMLPRPLCEELCSLNAGVNRLAFSVIWEMDSVGNIQSTWYGRTVIRSCAKLSYDHVQRVIDGAAVAVVADAAAAPLPPAPDDVTLYNGETWVDVARDALRLHALAVAMRRRRFEVGGSLRLDNAKLWFELDAEGGPTGYGVYRTREANFLVEEFMLAANMSAAWAISDAFPKRALLRRHPPPNGKKLEMLAKHVARLLPRAPFLEIDSSGALQRSLTALAAAVPPAVAEAVVLMVTRPMQLAEYFSTGHVKDEDEEYRRWEYKDQGEYDDDYESSDDDDDDGDDNGQNMWWHWALSVPRYTHFTSPIRRYPDIIVHRLLAASLERDEGDEEGRFERGGEVPLELMGRIPEYANERKLAAKSVQDGALKLYLAVMLLRQPQTHRGVIVGLGGPAYFDVFVPALGIEVRITVEQMLMGGRDAISSMWDPKRQRLKLELQSGNDGGGGGRGGGGGGRGRGGGRRRSSGTVQDTKPLDPSMFLPKYDDIENFDAMVVSDAAADGDGDDGAITPLELPLKLRALKWVPVILSGARHEISGGPAGIHAKLLLSSTPPPSPTAG